ncbi:MAG TPA: phosphomannomutase/phosphoglucomutase [Actinomycetota bacterium]|nr:phosphomannomutase/phosphoglucomutase [Actinomycetota bacterium]
MTRDLSAIFKAYDVRGLYPEQLDEDAARRIGSAFARFAGSDRIAVGRDMRLSSESLAAAFGQGAAAGGAAVVDLGLVSTDGLYFGSGHLDLPAVMFTASHNPPQYNGLKMCRERAAPIGQDTGLAEIKASAEAADEASGETGAPETENILERYAAHCRGFVDTSALAPLKVAIDAGNGMAGLTAPAVFEPLPIEVVPLFFELDGTFPNHLANPIEPANLVDLQKAVTEQNCDVGIAFDGDADRIFLVDESAALVSGSLTTALVAERLLKKHPGESIIYNLICSWTVREVIAENGGTPIRSRVGHSFIKEVMAKTGAIFGGEHSGHYYFRDNFRADSGMIAALLVLEAMSETGQALSKLLAPFRRYEDSGEINFEVADQGAAMDVLAERYSDGDQDRVDGLTVAYPDWWFNCRPSNTEPLLRLNLEARTKELLQEKLDEITRSITGGGDGHR